MLHVVACNQIAYDPYKEIFLKEDNPNEAKNFTQNVRPAVSNLGKFASDKSKLLMTYKTS